MEGRKRIRLVLALVAGLATAGIAQAWGPGMHPDDLIIHVEHHRDGGYTETWQTPDGSIYYKWCEPNWGLCHWFL